MPAIITLKSWRLQKPVSPGAAPVNSSPASHTALKGEDVPCSGAGRPRYADCSLQTLPCQGDSRK